MEAFVYISKDSGISPGLNSYALRTGLLISPVTVSIGNAYLGILFESLSKQWNNTPERKISFLRQKPEFNHSGLDADVMIRELRFFWSKRRDSRALKLYKTLENRINNLYAVLHDDYAKLFHATGLLQLAPLQESDELVIIGLDEATGEQYQDGLRLSSLLSLSRDPDDTPGPYVHVLIGNLTEIPPEDEATLVPVLDLPNVNALSFEQLMGVRKSLASQMASLQALLIPDSGPDSPFNASHWDLDRVPLTAPSIQQAVDADPDLSWARTVQASFGSKVLIGHMDIKRFFQLQRDCGQVPDDTWLVLSGLEPRTDCPASIPIIVIRTEWRDESSPTEVLAANVADDYVPARKTISLD